jgi:uncharacterized phosphosugar-binding protein
MDAATEYYERTIALLERLRATQMETIDAAAEICAETIAKNGLVFIFGSGHSSMLAEEMTPRQGCFVGFFAWKEGAVTDHSNTVGRNGLRPTLFFEKIEGYAEELLNGFKFGPNDSIIIVSTSGVRPLIVEMALGAKARGLPVIAINSIEHASNSKPAYKTGQKLMDVADVVIDNVTPPGDCVVEIEGLEWRTGPTSTVTGAMITNMLRCATAEKLVARGHIPVMLPSHQFIGNATANAAEEQLEHYYEAYRKSIGHLYE